MSFGGRSIILTKDEERDLKAFLAKKTTAYELAKKWGKPRTFVTARTARIAHYAENY